MTGSDTCAAHGRPARFGVVGDLPDDNTLILETLFDIRVDVGHVIDLLEDEDEDEEEEEDVS